MTSTFQTIFCGQHQYTYIDLTLVVAPPVIGVFSPFSRFLRPISEALLKRPFGCVALMHSSSFFKRLQAATLFLNFLEIGLFTFLEVVLLSFFSPLVFCQNARRRGKRSQLLTNAHVILPPPFIKPPHCVRCLRRRFKKCSDAIRQA